MKSFKQVLQSTLLMYLVMVAISSSAQQPVNTEPSKEQAPLPATSAYTNTQLTYTIIPAENNTWGYEIFNEGKLMISQKSIPALPGNNGFREQEQAMKVAELVIQKIRKGEMPPTVSVEELNAMGIK